MTFPATARRSAVLLCALAAALGPGLGSAPAALAHTTLISSSPEEGETLDTAPEEVTLTFNGDVGSGGNAIIVTGPNGQTYDDGDVRIEGAEASMDLLPLTSAGDYTIGYRIISADGHPVEEEMTFSLAEGAASEPADEGSASPAEDAEKGTEEDTAGEEPSATEAPADPMSALGPVGGVIAAIAVLALIAILIVRMRNRPGNTDGRGRQ